MATILEVKNIQTRFFIPEGVVKALDNVSFNIENGKTLGVLGESGCGKSITALTIMGLIPSPPGEIMSGSVILEGTDLLRLTKDEMRKIRGSKISMIFQEPMTSLNPVYTVGNQLSETFLTHENISQKEARDQSIEMLQLVGIPAPEKRITEYPHQLSGGMRQRVMIAMALACKPKLLIADEPTTALDVTIQAQIMDLIAKLQEELGMAVMMITHDIGVIAEMSDKVVVMYAGQIVETGTIEEILSDPLHPYTQGLIASIPKLGEKFETGKEKLTEIPGFVPNLIRQPPGCLFAPRCSHVIAQCRKKTAPFFEKKTGHGAKCWLLQ